MRLALGDCDIVRYDSVQALRALVAGVICLILGNTLDSLAGRMMVSSVIADSRKILGAAVAAGIVVSGVPIASGNAAPKSAISSQTNATASLARMRLQDSMKKAGSDEVFALRIAVNEAAHGRLPKSELDDMLTNQPKLFSYASSVVAASSKALERGRLLPRTDPTWSVMSW